ncbi:hypothetical protein AVEN_152929-1 [Araneus ventricosus]|uniref:Uncharacterized protein n=1 Tax=Araneus ventricosus TaxID=182803 RepID=A0A4Y2ADD8_ARAVE|nr:hypothetical protein AVEN_152929-1 [Araneus ventricosus]
MKNSPQQKTPETGQAIRAIKFMEKLLADPSLTTFTDAPCYRDLREAWYLERFLFYWKTSQSVIRCDAINATRCTWSWHSSFIAVFFTESRPSRFLRDVESIFWQLDYVSRILTSSEARHTNTFANIVQGMNDVQMMIADFRFALKG